MKTLIEDKLKEIANAVYLYVDSTSDANPALLSGDMGVALFLAYYSKYTNDSKYEDAFNIIFDKCIDKVADGVYIPTYCSGVAGTLYCIQHLKENNFVDIDISEADNYYNKFLMRVIGNNINENNNDFLHGATGIILYLLKNNNNNSISSIIKYIEHLELSGIQDKKSIKWESDVGIGEKKVFNIALSHGMSSVAVILSIALKSNIAIKTTKIILDKTINYILQQMLNPELYGSCFPSYSIESDGDSVSGSRLGWCYGDLGIAMALWQIGVSTSNEDLVSTALKVLKYNASKRENIENAYVLDARICHGAVGIAQIFKRIYIETNEECFLDASNYWIAETLRMSKWDDGIAGYKFFKGKDNEWDSAYNILDGIAGVGLGLLASIGDSSYSDWDEMLLLSMK